jgi:hypothetical protein
MKTIRDVRSFASLLGRSIDSPEIQDLINTYHVRPAIDEADHRGSIDCSQFGFDVLLTAEQPPSSPGDQEAEWIFRVAVLRFFSEDYCKNKACQGYAGLLLDGVRFPIDGKALRARLSSPSKVVRGVRHYDRYDYPDCSVRFVYPKNKDHVAFVEVHPPATVESEPMVGGERIGHVLENRHPIWKSRLVRCEKIFGNLIKIYPGSQIAGGPTIDVLVFRKSEDYFTLVTNGMSDRRMHMPKNSRDPARLELLMYSNEIDEDLVQRLVQDAAYPFVERTYLGHGDTIDWMTPVVPQSELTADLLIYSIVEKHRDLKLEIEGDPIHLLWVVPITADELEYKKARGLDALLAVFDEVKHPLVLSTDRRSYL